jgi:asparagine synthase (glutamine-hydrolysing)
MGHMPMANEDESICITFNGEIYNYKELRAQLEALGHQFRSNSDTEAIIHAYEQWGFESPKFLRGMFVYAIWDKRKKIFFGVRDRLGKKPFFYTRTKNAFVFGSELRSLLLHPEVERKINFNAINAFFNRVYIPAPLSGFENIFKLPAAHYVVIENGQVNVQRYWHVDFAPKTTADEPELRDELWELLVEAVRIRLMSDVPLGALLSGGVDSSAVVGIMSQLTSTPVNTFSIRFNEQGFDETEHARKIAQLFGTQHYEFNVEPDAMGILPELVWHYGEPFGDYSSIPSYYVSKMARQYVTVALSGDAGDENFAGYKRYRTDRYLQTYRRLPGPIKKRAIPGLLREIGKLPRLANSAHQLETVAMRGASSPAEAYLYSYSHFSPASAVGMWEPQVAGQIDSAYMANSIEKHLENFNGNGSLDRMLYMDLMSYLPDDINVKMDIASMANSLEVRAPFMDHKIVEFAAKLPADFKRRGSIGKYLLKKTLERLLPNDILYRPKHGFSVPISAWLRGPMRNMAEQILLDPKTTGRGLLRSENVRRIVAEHMQGTIDHGMRIWLLLNFELWQRTYVDQLRSTPLTL